MNTCDTCKWWDKELMVGISITTIQNKCVNEKVSGRKSARFDDENILFIKGTDEWEGLYTGPKFGCIHHESK